ncbi:MAG: diguanylate cyclase [Acidobacteria bacterium]|nr:MAG: diguanylate cyclase [Acidobacteriota bacterium]
MDRFKIRSGVLSSVLFLVSIPIRADTQKATQWTGYPYPIQFEHLSVEQGLSQSSVTCILQDGKGFLWFGTDDGLNRYDGYNFKIYRNNPANHFSVGSNRIRALLEDRKGILWVGTSGGGLNRYDRDRNRFVRYTYDPSRYYDPNKSRGLSDNDVRCILEDRDGQLWIGTDGSGIGRLVWKDPSYTDYSFVAYPIAEEDPRGFNREYVSVLFEDRAGVLWVGTEDGGLVRVTDKTKATFQHYLPDPLNPASSPSNQITSIAEDQEGNLWVGTQDGLAAFDPRTRLFHRYLHNPADVRSLSSSYVRIIFRDRAGVLWIGTDGAGLNKLVLGKHPGSPPEFIRYRYDPAEPHGLNDNSIESIFEDRSGVLWVGTYNGGLNKLILRNSGRNDRERRAFVHYAVKPAQKQHLSHDSVNAILEDSRGTLWIGTDGGGLNQVDPPASPDSPLPFVHHQANSGAIHGLNDNVVTAIGQDSEGDIWIGTFTGGLNRLPRAMIGRPSPSFLKYQYDPNDPGSLSNNFVKSILRDRRGRLWIGTIDGGLNRFDPRTNKFVRYHADDRTPGNLSDNSVFAMGEDPTGRLWIGTAEGLNRYDPDQNRFLHCKSDPDDPASLSSNLVRSIYTDRHGILWIGTDGGGLNKLISGAEGERPRFSHYRMADGLPNDSVLGILEDDAGDLWLSTHHGICRFDPRTEELRNYDRSDGLQGNDFRGGACWKSRSGELFFGGARGFNVFHPSQVRDNPTPPPIVILDFQIFNKPVPVDSRPENGRAALRKFVTEIDEIQLSHRDAVFSFEFAALHYVAPEKNEYAYRMEGLEEDWNYVGNRRFVTYTTLPAGDYVFHVKGANSDGIWNQQGLSLKIHISPPFWKTAWFSGLLAATALLLAGALYQFRVRQLKSREAELQQQVQERIRQVARANKQLSVVNSKLRRMATKDQLTGIANIRLFRSFFYREWRRVVRNQLPISLIMVDVDFFKLYNDTYGHVAGDECLRKVAVTIEKYAQRAGDLAARYGGEEFILVLSEVELPAAAALAEKIRSDVQSLGIAHARSNISPYVTISLGCVTLIPAPGERPNRLLEEVDNALYQSKKDGRNRITVAGLARTAAQRLKTSVTAV